MPLVRARGFNLIELMVAMAIGMILLLGASTFFVNMLQSTGNNLMRNKLDAELRMALQFISNDVKRAGYYQGKPSLDSADLAALAAASITGNGINVINASVNPDTFLRMYRPSATPAGSCLLYAYNRNGNLIGGNRVDRYDDGELTGIRLNDGVLQVRTSCVACSYTSCSAGTWSDLTDAALIEITALSFSNGDAVCSGTTPPVSQCPWPSGAPLLSLNVSISGRLKTKPGEVRQLSTKISLENQVVALP
ncbi:MULTISPECIES: prepilin-type N-terminal cleavage/methylation domain-containing protein [Deefgea]|uniref:Prepilin-type N-terminal cleavage/methylation domain-containing protein n=1 Tax=Deefgea chitinilytica TaxID=570276 RepID=A0ABS2CEM8_9NEIS|nr:MULTISPECIES: prepilin-type N-terminal cleavage/methylation domain-containing protein [Deefgea]MBM5572613.1 prepilin-type N-terminal cleavage/methylation domain-containing protein [Deefgea chitinilytica]MBM9889849.1 prepilin-type N-terminal cleavage/methylation domain-containing protein [Deefgea sp. CFH1-16]